MAITLNDAEQRFADSPLGQLAVAKAERSHALREAHKGSAARPWTDAMAADAVRVASAAHHRNELARKVQDSAAPIREAAAQTAYRMAVDARNAELRSAYRKG